MLLPVNVDGVIYNVGSGAGLGDERAAVRTEMQPSGRGDAERVIQNNFRPGVRGDGDLQRNRMAAPDPVGDNLAVYAVVAQICPADAGIHARA